MPRSIHNMPETNMLGVNTREWAISRTTCRALAERSVSSLGITNVGKGYRMIRHHPDFSHVTICLEGAGRVWVNDGWQEFPAGNAILLPENLPHGGFYDEQPWRLCWVAFDPAPKRSPGIVGPLIRVVPVDPRPLEWALLGLYHEVNGKNDPSTLNHYAELILQQVDRMVSPDLNSSRLTRVWEAVDAAPAHPWTARELAEMACVSEVHLRRITMKELGHSPMQQVARLRILRAAYLLEMRGQSVESASWEVGYQSTSAFTRAFKHWMARLPRRK